jgi:hypothetical protein
MRWVERSRRAGRVQNDVPQLSDLDAATCRRPQEAGRQRDRVWVRRLQHRRARGDGEQVTPVEHPAADVLARAEPLTAGWAGRKAVR